VDLEAARKALKPADRHPPDDVAAALDAE